ncbi:hypothetical protein T11_17195 [Trichinella zimbabwensis]|uniref:Uncharacterized protein n=1 Tax=Trichinella zimbabwensis TaxID=268475 RepID=A0A0V1HQN1_9BILA|nr:hypothetical protein T11_17195 [Trichinella zimbabwensis]
MFPSVGNLRRVNSVYAEKAGRVAQYAVDFNEERFRRDLVDLIKTAFRLDFFTLLFLLRRDFRPLLDLGRAAGLRATFLPRLFLLVILLDLERIIRPSISSWASPLHMVLKKERNTWRHCGDSRRLNNVTKA